jgi:hypothetical protein
MKKTVASILALAALAAPTAAIAQDAGSEGYEGVLGQIGTVDSSPSSPARSSDPAPIAVATPAQVADTGSLPFTGSDAWLVAAFGGLLIAAGFGLRRLRVER